MEIELWHSFYTEIGDLKHNELSNSSFALECSTQTKISACDKFKHLYLPFLYLRTVRNK